MVILANTLGGENVRNYFKFVPREWFEFVDRKKWIFTILVYLVGNTIQGSLTSSGAFEVFVDNKLVRLFLILGMVKVAKRRSTSPR
jgi:hypothetical protein